MQAWKTATTSLFATAIALAACTDDDNDDGFNIFDPDSRSGSLFDAGFDASSAQETGAGQSNSPQGVATFAPSEVGSLVLVLNQDEVALSQEGISKATSPDVRQFAEQMVSEHQQALQRTQPTMQQLGASASDPTAAVLARGDQLVLQDVQAATQGSSFDLAFMTVQIAAHAKTLAMIDRSLITSLGGPSGAGFGVDNQAVTAPGAQDLRIELVQMRTRVAQHLDRALVVQRTVRVTPAATVGP